MSKATLYTVVPGKPQDITLKYVYPKLNPSVKPMLALQEMLDNEDMTDEDIVGSLDRGIPLWFNHLAKTDPKAKAARLEAERKTKPGRDWDIMIECIVKCGKTREEAIAMTCTRPTDLV
jgi:hypothetical protein